MPRLIIIIGLTTVDHNGQVLSTSGDGDFPRVPLRESVALSDPAQVQLLSPGGTVTLQVRRH